MGFGKKKGPKPEEVYEAVKANKKDDVQSLLEAKCDPNAHKDQFVSRPPPPTAAVAAQHRLIMPACPFHSPPASRAHAPAPPTLQTGDVCLHVAANKGRTELIEMLIGNGANVNLQNKVRPTCDPGPFCAGGAAPPRGRSNPPSRAHVEPRPRTEASLPAHASLPASPPFPGARPAALRPRRPSRPPLSLVSSRQLGQTALHCAAGYGATSVVKTLVDKGADKEIQDMDGNTPADLANNYGAAPCPRPRMRPHPRRLPTPLTPLALRPPAGQNEVVALLKG